jgi:hypothetical protein
MIEVDIKEPIWKAPSSVGVNIPDNYSGPVKISISYRKRDGTLLYPNPWIVDTRFIRNFPTRIMRRNVKLYIIPINLIEKESC